MSKKVVFFPVSAYMWDCFESVYLSLKTDPEIETYVIPIPYIVKNAEGKTEKEVYDIDEYPPYIPVIDHRDIEFDHFSADIAFICFPYDGLDKVIDIPPFFYSANLKKHAGKLVYIPYFIFKNTSIFNKSDVAEAEPFCVTPAALNADMVMVQSESIKEVYCRALEGSTGGRVKKEVWAEKVFATGSPKLDKLTRLCVEGVGMPEKWQELMGPDGKRRKKFLLYSVSPATFAEDPVKAVVGILETIKLFEKYKDHIVPVFRPHPFYRANVAAFRPDLLKTYDNAVEYFVSSEMGIYDTGPDVCKTLVMCDAYLGDRGSLAPMMKAIDKKFLVVNDINDKKEIEQFIAKTATMYPTKKYVKQTRINSEVLKVLKK